MVPVETRPVGPAELGELECLFACARTTRHCWCTAFCTTRTQFATGWFGGGNRRRFAALAAGGTPMGVLALSSDEPVGWGACGRRARYAVSPAGRRLLDARTEEDGSAAWLVPCLFVHPDHRGEGVGRALVGAAVDLARGQHATVLEAWPLAASATNEAEAFVGREPLFAELGFRTVGRPAPGRVLMRLDLA